MKQLIRFATLILALTLLTVSVIPLLGVVALTPDDVTLSSAAVTPLEEALILHYDFLGDTQTECLRDKATGGTKSENANLVSTETDGEKDSHVSNGEAYVSQKSGNYLNALGLTDVKALTSGYTVFCEFRPEPAEGATGNATVLWIADTMRFTYSMTSSKLFVGIGSLSSVNGGDSGKALEPAEGEYIRAAWSATFDPATNQTVGTLYISMDEGTTWTAATKTVTASGTAMDKMFENAVLIFGKLATSGNDIGFSCRYRDFRIYDRALTEDEVKGISVAPLLPDPPDVAASGIDPSCGYSPEFYFPASEAAKFNSLHASVTVLDKTVTLIPAAETKAVLMNGKQTECAVFRYDALTAPLLGDTLSVTLTGEKDGKTYTGATYETSAVAELLAIIRSDTADAKIKRVAVDLLKYGAAAQIFASHRTDAPANAALTAAELALGTGTPTAPKSVLGIAKRLDGTPTVGFHGASIGLTDPITLNIRLVVPNEGLHNTAVLKITDAEGTEHHAKSLAGLAADEDGILTVTIELSGLTDLRRTLYITVLDGDSAISHTLTYSAESYLAWCVQSGNPVLADLATAMLCYSDALAELISGE